MNPEEIQPAIELHDFKKENPHIRIIFIFMKIKTPKRILIPQGRDSSPSILRIVQYEINTDFIDCINVLYLLNE